MDTDWVASRSGHSVVARIATLFLVTFLLACASFWARSESRKHFLQVTELAGVRLGMTPQEVIAALGQPNVIDSVRVPGLAGRRSKRDTALGFVYSRPFNTDYSLQIVFFDHQFPRLGIACEVHSNSSALGLTWGAKERTALHQLGRPQWVSVSADHKQKIISYPRWNVAYFIEKRRVIGVCISDGGPVEFVDAA